MGEERETTLVFVYNSSNGLKSPWDGWVTSLDFWLECSLSNEKYDPTEHAIIETFEDPKILLQ